MSDSRLAELVDETRRAAANIEHPWDHQALDWPLTTESVVVDVGGYKGRWALQIAERYRSRLYVFEPQPWAAAVCREVLGERATVEGYGLGTKNAVLPMEHWETDGCTFVTIGPRADFGELREIGEAFEEFGVAHIDLMMMNIEGYEYTLIPHMLDQGIYPDRLMVQFHAFADPDGAQLVRIHERMAEADYTVPWTYGPLLSAWERTAQPALRKRGRKRAS